MNHSMSSSSKCTSNVIDPIDFPKKPSHKRGKIARFKERTRRKARNTTHPSANFDTIRLVLATSDAESYGFSPDERELVELSLERLRKKEAALRQPFEEAPSYAKEYVEKRIKEHIDEWTTPRPLPSPPTTSRVGTLGSRLRDCGLYWR